MQFFGVRGYGEGKRGCSCAYWQWTDSETVEFILGIIKILAVLGFIIFGIVVDCGGVSSDDRGYIGFRYWNDAEHGNKAFRNGKQMVLSRSD